MRFLALKRRLVGVPRFVSIEANRVSSVTEWVLQRQAERWRVTVKVNKIKAGNLRASVLHKQWHRRQGGSVKDKGGWEDYRVCASISADVCVLAWIGWWDPHLLCEKYIVTEWWGSLNVSVCSVHTMLGQLCPVNWLKTAGVETVSTLAESAGTITCQSIVMYILSAWRQTTFPLKHIKSRRNTFTTVTTERSEFAVLCSWESSHWTTKIHKLYWSYKRQTQW